ncbi:sugar kinase [Gillisia sp. M10.2A]|uniref:Sugar kinase n=1 Tax=Gillisia lutea TaxID=2909668 RepID=A0ABS9EE01_9FLAO|nr:sugar kinase [Gillisia lutea]MCF4101093.1 sugar kinase [Gillisia lutea]
MKRKLVTFGEILMRLSCEDHLRFSQAHTFNVVYGGSEANVAISASNFGMSVDFVSVVPHTDFGNASLAELKISKVGTDNIVFRGKRLGLYFLEKGAVNRGSKVIYDRANSSFAEVKSEWFDWEDILKNCNQFHWSGITPAISKAAAEVCLEAVETAEKMGISISADLNYRGNLWQYDVIPEEIMTNLVSKSNVLLAGGYACKQFFGIQTQNSSNLELFEELTQKFPKLEKIAITNRIEMNASHHKWSANLYNGKTILNSTEYDIFPIVDRVGTGDSFMGALLYGLQHYEDQQALDFATAASCIKHSIYGDINRVSKEEVVKLMEGDISGRISR